MITLSTKHDILRAYVFHGTPKKQIAKKLGISKNTVKKYINEYEQQRSALIASGESVDKDRLIELICTRPAYDSSNRQPRVANPTILNEIKQYLAQNEQYRQQGLAKQCMKAVDIHDALLDAGHRISYTTVNRYVNQFKTTKKEAFIKQTYEPGAVCEFDWGDVKLDIHGCIKTYKMAVFTSAKGNYRFAKLYPKEATEFFLDAHVQFFDHIQGVYKTVVYDNMKVAVARFIGKTEKEATQALKNISLYYQFNYRFCNVRRGNEKGHVEKSVDVVRRKAFSRNIVFDSLEAANMQLTKILSKHNAKPLQKSGQAPTDVLEEEQPFLLPWLPPFDVATTKECRVDKYSTITIEGNHYSVPDALVRQFVTAKCYTDCIRVYAHQTEVANHPRQFGADQWELDLMHYKETLLKKPGAIAGSLAFTTLHHSLQQLFTRYFVDNPREFIYLLELIPIHSFDTIVDSIKQLEATHVYVNVDNIKLLVERQTVGVVLTIEHNEASCETVDLARQSNENYAKLFELNTAFEQEATPL